MSDAEKLFLKLLKCGIQGISEELPETDLMELEDISVSHRCVPLVYQGAVCCGTKPSAQWKEAVVKSAMRNELNLHVQKEVLRVLKEAGITCAIMKGSSVAVYYPEPYLRPLGDIDVLVEVADYEKAVSVLKNDSITKEAEKHPFHCKIVIDGIAVEIHKYVTEYSSDAYGKKIAEIMKNALENVCYATYEGYQFPVLAEKYQAMSLLLHMQRHFFENRLTMRMLCDWAVFIQQTDIENWKSDIVDMIKKSGLDKLSDAMTGVCHLYLGADCAEKMITDADAALCEDIITEFVSNGACKNAEQTSRNVGTIYAQNIKAGKSKAFALLLTMNEVARRNFNLAKHPIFLPLFWIYIPIRYIVLVLLGKKDMLSADTFQETATRRSRIEKQLNLND